MIPQRALLSAARRRSAWLVLRTAPTTCTTIQYTARRAISSSSLFNNDDKPDQSKSKPATKSLLQEIINQQRKKRPPTPPPPQQPTLERALPLTTTPPPLQESVLDVFTIPEKAPERIHSPDAFANIDAYLEELERCVFSHPKWRRQHTASPIPEQEAAPARNYLERDNPLIEYQYPILDAMLQNNNSDNNQTVDRHDPFRQQVLAQREAFLTKSGLTDDHLDMISRALFSLTGNLAKKGSGKAVNAIWEKVKESGLHDKGLLRTLLYLSAAYPSCGRRAKRKSKFGHLTGMKSILDELDVQKYIEDDGAVIVDDNNSLVDLTDEIALYHDLLHQPTEQSTSIRVRLLVSQGHGGEAEQVLDSYSGVRRLRSYLPVLRLFLELGDVASALRLYHKMQAVPEVLFDSDTYVYLLSGLAEHGAFRKDAAPIPGALELGHEHACGPGLFDELVQDMSQEVFEIPEALAKKLYDGLAKGFPDSNLVVTSSLSPLRLAEEPAPLGQVFANKIRIDPTTGLCPRTGLKLRLVELKEEETGKLVDGVLQLAKKNYEKHHRRNKASVPADELLLEFYNWLDNREGEPYTAIVDGPNVAYYEQNFADGGFSFRQVYFLVMALEKMGENVLVVLPSKYSGRNYFQVSNHANRPEQQHGRRQYLSDEEKRIRNDLLERGKIWWVPPGYLDDLYWILTSVSQQTKSRKGRDLSVSPEDIQGRWPGKRPVLVSNDQMRDHHLEMLEPMLFRRWYSNNIVNYHLSAVVDGKRGPNSIGFSAADFYSREIQGNKDEAGSMVWHFPVADSDQEWFCIRIPDAAKAEN